MATSKPRVMVSATAESGETRMMRRSWLAEIVIMPKLGVSDPAGSAVHGGLKNLGYEEVDDVRVGRFVRVAIGAQTEAAAFARAVEMCDDLLANPVIEEYQITVHDSETDAASKGHGSERG